LTVRLDSLFDNDIDTDIMDAVRTNPKRTAVGNHLHQENVNGTGNDDFEVPKVDMARAASIRPSKVKGKHVMWLVTFVAGMGVSHPSLIRVSRLINSSLCLVTIKVF
jgi:hypothetical protein